MKPSYEELEARCAALAAENAKLADCANFYRLGFKPVKGAFGIEYRPTEQLLDDCGNTAIEAIKTPATDSFLAEVRAHDLNAFIRHHSAELDAHIKNGGEQFDEKSVRIRDIIVSARLFREQIRKEAAQ